MKDKDEFYQILSAIDGLDRAEYGRIIGDFDFGRFVLKINRVPAEGESQVTLIIVRVPQSVAGFPPHLFNTPVRRTAIEDLLSRKLAEGIRKFAAFNHEGVARRRLSVSAGSQKIIPRSSLNVTDENVEARLYVTLPIHQDRIAAQGAKAVFFDELPTLVSASLIHCNLDVDETERFVDTMEDADQLRQALPTRGMVSFVAEGSMLSRQGDTDLPDFVSERSISVADDIRIQIDVPNAGSVRGLGVPGGVTVILGDDHSGRHELMQAIASGIYNHVPGDGREYVITLPDAVYVAAERNRSVQRVDLSLFLSSGQEPRKAYSTGQADPVSGQAASVIEALEVGARALIFDESDSAPGFLSTDSRLASMLAKGKSRTVPLSARARQITDELGVSVIVGGHATVAEFIPVADTVLLIEDGRVRDVTKDAKQLGVQALKAEAGDLAKSASKARWVIPSSIDASVGRHDAEIEATSLRVLRFGRTTIDLSGVYQLADSYQTGTIGLILNYAKTRYMDDGRPMREILDLVDRDLSTDGLECLSREFRGDLARPRRYEIAAALNRLSTLRISHAGE